MSLAIADKDIGGARVVRTFTRNVEGELKYLKRGDNLTRDEVLAFSSNNRIALIGSNYIEVYPLAPTMAPSEPGERFLVGVGKNQFNVIEGRALNKEPVTREEADRLMLQKVE